MHAEEDESAQQLHHKENLLQPGATPPLQLVVDLPLFSHAILYQQAATYTAAALGAKKEVSAAAAAGGWELGVLLALQACNLAPCLAIELATTVSSRPLTSDEAFSDFEAPHAQELSVR